MFYTDSFDSLLNGYSSVIGQIQIAHIDTRIRLVPCHGCGAVVEYDQGNIVVVENGINQSGNTGVKEGGISYKSNDLFVGCLGESTGRTHGLTHANKKITH